MAALLLALFCIVIALYAAFTTGAQWGAGAALFQHCPNPSLTKQRKVIIDIGLFNLAYTLTFDVHPIDDEEPILEPDDDV